MSYPWGAETDPSAPWNDDGLWHRCTICGEHLEPHEQADPILINDEAVCDRCADRLQTLEY